MAPQPLVRDGADRAVPLERRIFAALRSARSSASSTAHGAFRFGEVGWIWRSGASSRSIALSTSRRTVARLRRHAETSEPFPVRHCDRELAWREAIQGPQYDRWDCWRRACCGSWIASSQGLLAMTDGSPLTRSLRSLSGPALRPVSVRSARARTLRRRIPKRSRAAPRSRAAASARGAPAPAVGLGEFYALACGHASAPATRGHGELIRRPYHRFPFPERNIATNSCTVGWYRPAAGERGAYNSRSHPVMDWLLLAVYVVQ